jgi:hypothetical protein
MVLYMALLTAFSFLERRKKRKKEGAREPGRGTAGELARIGGGRAAAWLEVCRRCSWRLLWS